MLPKTKFRASNTLRQLARQMGVNVRDPVGYDPQSAKFYTAQDYAAEQEAIDQAHLIWLLDLGQRAAEPLKPDDLQVMLPSFVGLYADREPDGSADSLRKLAGETVGAVRRLVHDGKPWELPTGNIRRVLERIGSHTLAVFRTADWLTAFRLRASDLVAAHSEQIRECKDCGRVFFSTDKRQLHCSNQCARRLAHKEYVKRTEASKQSGSGREH
jgi:hypothetical protein